MQKYSQFVVDFLNFNNIPESEWEKHLSKEIRFPDFPVIKSAKKISSMFKDALKKQDRIMLSADYDADGTTAAIVMYKFLKSCGFNIDKDTLYLPTRENGYGMNAYAIKKMHEEHGVKILITMDCGISNIKEIEYANHIGIKTVICDHHTVGDQIPEADFILHPEVNSDLEPLKHFSGAGIAFYLCWLLNKELNLEFDIEEWSAIAAIGGIGDMTPMLGLHRDFIKYGLHKIRNTSLSGLQALKDISKATEYFDEESLVFQLIPRMNAAGRLADPIWAFATLATDSYDQAYKSAEKLDKLNSSRRDICSDYAEMAESMIDHNDPVIIISSEDFKHGIVGITAANLVDKYNKPAFVIADEGFQCKGSARTPVGFNTYKALEHAKHALDKFGGHEMASGFTFQKEKMEELIFAINESYYDQIENKHVLDKNYQQWKGEYLQDSKESMKQLLSDIELLKPIGQGFKSPEFKARLKIKKPSTNLSRKHLFCKFQGVKCVGWGLFDESLTDGDLCDIVFTVGSTDYQRKKPYVRFTLKSIERVES